MTVAELIEDLRRCDQSALVEIDYPVSGGRNARPCEGVGASSHHHVVLWARTPKEAEEEELRRYRRC